MDVKVSIQRSGTTPLAREILFERLADIPSTIQHFPKLRALTPLDNHRYRWELDSMGAAGIYHQIVFATDFVIDHDSGVITLEPVPDEGNAQIAGQFITRQEQSHSHCELSVAGELHAVPVPRLLGAPGKKFISRLFEDLVDKFVERVIAEHQR